MEKREIRHPVTGNYSWQKSPKQPKNQNFLRAFSFWVEVELARTLSWDFLSSKDFRYSLRKVSLNPLFHEIPLSLYELTCFHSKNY